MLRHALTLGLLCEHLPLEQETDPIAIIGDGFANMASMILAHLPSSRVILVNLTKTLLVDLAFLYQAFPEIGFCHVDNAGSLKEALAREELRVVAVRADDAEILSEAPIQLAINILSMMEIDPPITARYFDVLRRAPRAETAFYCCNRVEKTLPDGTVTRFFEYPWNPDDQILMEQPCPWTAIAYRGRPPFYYRGPEVFHRLVMLKKL